MINNIGIIGLGSIGCRHLRLARELRSDLNIVAVRSRKGKNIEEEKLVDSIVYSLEDAIDCGIEAAIIATPAVYHVQQAIELMGKGIHVLIEKPLSHSLDNAKLAVKLSQFEKEYNKKIKIFVQVNLANETQKSGILLNDLNVFYNYCTKELSLNIIGLMCMPPLDSDSSKYYQILKKTGEKLNLKNYSMGMSADYEQAILNGSTYLRLGTEIFGERIS